MARAEPAIILTLDLTGFLAKRDTTKMRTDADDNKKLGLLDANLVFLRMTKLGTVDGIRAGDLVTGAMPDEHRLAAPGHGDGLTLGDF